MLDPIVIDPPGFDCARVWERDHLPAQEALAKGGGRNEAAAFCADPGIVGCPSCGRDHWAFGVAQRCTCCGHEYDTDWWCMFSWGTQRKWRGLPPDAQRYERSAYYRFGYDNPAQNGSNLSYLAFEERVCGEVSR